MAVSSLVLLEKLTEVEAAFIDWFKSYHTGVENSITSRRMRQQWGSAPLIRKMVHSLRRKGVPVCSTNQGYYYARTQEDVKQAVVFLTGYINEITAARNGLALGLLNSAESLPVR